MNLSQTYTPSFELVLLMVSGASRHQYAPVQHCLKIALKGARIYVGTKRFIVFDRQPVILHEVINSPALTIYQPLFLHQHISA